MRGVARSARVATAIGVVGATGLVFSYQMADVAHAAAPSGSLQPYTSSTVATVAAANGDNNPYGIAIVPLSMGNLVAGNLLVVDFNHGSTAGGGTSVLQVNPSTAAVSLFASGPPISGPVGVAINPANDGVWIGNFGSSDGSNSNDLLISPAGTVVATFNATTVNANAGYSGPKPTFDGVWGQGVSQITGQVSFYFGTTGAGATGTGGGQVWRIDPHPAGTANGQPVNSTYAKVATGLGDNATVAALPVTTTNAAGPQGFAYDPASGTLYVSNDADNTITAIPGAATATGPATTHQVPVASGVLNVPENIAIAPGTGDLLVTNAGNNTLLDINPATGAINGSRILDGGARGALFGLAVTTDSSGHPKIFFVDDNTNTLNVLTYTTPTPTPSATTPNVPATGSAPEVPLAPSLALLGLGTVPLAGGLLVRRRRSR